MDNLKSNTEGAQVNRDVFFYEKCSASYGELYNGNGNSSRNHNQHDPKKKEKKTSALFVTQREEMEHLAHRNPYMGNKQTQTERKYSSLLHQSSVAEKEMERDLTAKCAQHGTIR